MLDSVSRVVAVPAFKGAQWPFSLAPQAPFFPCKKGLGSSCIWTLFSAAQMGSFCVDFARSPSAHKGFLHKRAPLKTWSAKTRASIWARPPGSPMMRLTTAPGCAGRRDKGRARMSTAGNCQCVGVSPVWRLPARVSRARRTCKTNKTLFFFFHLRQETVRGSKGLSGDRMF